MSIKLYTDPSSTLHQEFADSNMNLQIDVLFKRAVVTAGTWIFYTYPNYNDKEAGGNRTNYKILKPGADEDITGVNGSMYLVKDQVEGIILFEHYYYGGERKVRMKLLNSLITSVKITLSGKKKFCLFAWMYDY